MEQQNCLGRDHGARESTSRREQLVRSEDLSELQGNSERSQPTETMEGDFIYRHDVEP